MTTTRIALRREVELLLGVVRLSELNNVELSRLLDVLGEARLRIVQGTR
jgi:hypothetical protein